MSTHTFVGTVFETPDRHTLNHIPDALIVVQNGTIQQLIDPTKDATGYASALQAAEAAGTLTRLKKGQYFIPGLIDLHVHAPQWPQLGMALDKPLEEWLQHYTFPLEAKYKDIEFAEKSYSSLVSTLLANGTTTVAYFASIHLEASVLLARICLDKGQRAVVGRVTMDATDQCPAYYCDPSPQEALRLSESFVQQVRALPGNTKELVLPAVIPRFIPSCTDESLRGLGEIAKKYGCHVQTHCSESDWEHNYVIDRFKKHDAFALDDFGLVTRRTILAHSNHLSHEDMELIKERGAAVGHCPLSNAYFAGAIFPLRKALDMDMHVGMGTDISGGPTASVFEVCRYSLMCARVLESGTDASLVAARRSQRSGSHVSSLEAFFVATANGGISLDLKIGRIAPGYFFDVLVIDTTIPNSSLMIFEDLETPEEVFEKIVYSAAPHNITHTYVSGRLVSQR
ncbi:putative guanine deaminase [Leptomonas pyrrhocoris]|uniref:Guanine deaminase n=1 Tax=Leptomonas pyrrhocoris TaxID=157538 RepID=A0A0N0DVJ2_LEPPY|nr:putative guanine deaminase [Leptomonas pyrrhocoris]XP_015658858.1 putative guanine deaminase [Leptomonas pyrrhocoris]XP_015658859.1 putative guanine deaminase [Leptomonas pyrrhocoris]KPA80418.1 putative guanine deaminase [Leptomonas pyrrhocoris]KPA80419.1 putative guanine deaminase [Leptomonas pyrrhocoris]KPA80420.1 putative guanine deaminase [Leptomonas pyrrhocoris]|eukprot:XP_015658857.1 putative guanine deaminase [Leptomonas pyrrhocoris]